MRRNEVQMLRSELAGFSIIALSVAGAAVMCLSGLVMDDGFITVVSSIQVVLGTILLSSIILGVAR